MIARFARAHDDQLAAQLARQRLGDRANQIEALLVGQSCNQADHWYVAPHGQPSGFLERGLVRRSLFDAAHVKLDRDMRIGGGIVQLSVDAIQDAEQPVATGLAQLGRVDVRTRASRFREHRFRSLY